MRFARSTPLRVLGTTTLLLAAVVAAALGAACDGGVTTSSTTSSTSSGTSSATGTGGSLTTSVSSSTGISQGQLTSVSFDPPSVTFALDGVTPGMQSFTLVAHYDDGSTEAVSAEAVEFDRPDLASVQIGAPIQLTASGAYAGVGTLHGIFKGKEATATVTVDLHVKDIDPTVDPAAIPVLDGAGLLPDPLVSGLLYPYDATVFPQGLASPRLMWNAPSATDVYRVHYEEPHYTFDGYYPVSLPASARVPQANWDKIVASSTGGPLSLELSRYDSAAKQAYSSAKETWTIAPASLRGAIYYWTTSGGGHMSRIEPGGSAQTLNGGACMGCHAVSSDGSTLVASVEGQVTNDGSNDNRAWVSFDLPAVTVRKTSTYFSGNVAVNNDGKYTVFGSQHLQLGDTATGQVYPQSGLDSMPLLAGSVGMMTPAFSPDGKHLAVVEGSGSWYHNLQNGRLATMDFDPSTQTFSNYVGLVNTADYPAGQRAISYPTYSPDSAWIAYQVGDHPSGCDSSCNDAETQLGAIGMQATAGTPPLALATLSNPVTPNAADQNHTTEPTFNPIERGGYFWVVVTSSRDYGNAITGTPNNGKKRLWVAAIDKNPAPGADPSHPAFFLDGQDETTTNMRGFWALSACIPTEGGGACSAGFECCSGFCDQGMCVTPQSAGCQGAGSSCMTAADCCNNLVVACTNNVCTPNVPQ